MKAIILLSLFCFGCAFGYAAAVPVCMARGFAIGRAKIHATCIPAKSVEVPPDAPKIAMPIADCPGRYNYFHECIEDEPKSSNLKMVQEEGYVEITGAPPSTSFWSTVFDFIVSAGTLAATYFKFGG